MFNIENYEVVLVPSEIDEDTLADGDEKTDSDSLESDSSNGNHPDALQLMEHDIIITFDQKDWPSEIPAGILVPEPCLDANLNKDILKIHCPIKGGIKEVSFLNVPDEVCDLLKQAGRLTLAGLNENGVVWEQTLSLF